VVVGFEDGEGGIEHFPARHDDDVEAGGNLVAPEHLSGEAFGAVAFDGRPEFPRGSHAKSRCRAAVGQHEHSHETAVDASALIVDALEFGPAADAFGNRESLPGHATRDLPLVGDGQTFPPFCPASLEDDPAVLGRHSDPEPVGFTAAAAVGLVSTFSLHLVLFA
jgi:hypothetical protein